MENKHNFQTLLLREPAWLTRSGICLSSACFVFTRSSKTSTRTSSILTSSPSLNLLQTRSRTPYLGRPRPKCRYFCVYMQQLTALADAGFWESAFQPLHIPVSYSGTVPTWCLCSTQIRLSYCSPWAAALPENSDQLWNRLSKHWREDQR